MKARAGQAMIETVLAVLIISSFFVALFKLSHMLTSKIFLEYAAMRVARARAVGFNDFMCWKSACVSVIPVAGKRLWPQDGDFVTANEMGRIPIYLQTADAARARGVLEYEGWHSLSAEPGNGTDVTATMRFSLFDGEFEYSLGGRAQLEENFPFYMMDGGR